MMEHEDHFSDDDSPMSNSTPHSEDDGDKHSEEFPRSPPTKYLEDSPPHDVAEAFAQQQRELLERLKEQFTTFPYTNHTPNFAGIDLSEQAHQRLQASEAQPPHDFPFSFPTPPPSKGEDDVKISTPASAKKSSQNASSWSYEDQFKQVRQLYEINDDPKRKEFLDDLFMFMKDRGSPINRLPIMAKSVLDLYELYKLVIGRGGLVNVINKKLWQEIIKDLNLPSSITSAAFTLRTQYTKYLYPYECEKYNLSSETELQAAIENNKRDGSRRSTSSAASYSNQFTQQAPQNQQAQQQQLQQHQLQMAMATQLAANANSVGLNLSPASNGHGSNSQPESSTNPQMNDMSMVQQRFMMMMFLYNQFLAAQQQQSSS